MFKIGQTRNDFSAEFFDRQWKRDWVDVMNSQTAGMKIDLLHGEVVLYVRQLKSGAVQDVLFHMITNGGRTIDQLRVRPAKAKKSGAEYVFTDGEMIDHMLELDYRSKDVMVHRITLAFDHVTLHSPTGEGTIEHSTISEDERLNAILNSIGDIDDADLPSNEVEGLLTSSEKEEGS